MLSTKLCVWHRVARTLGYRYVAFTSNQVSIPSGSISVLRAALGERAVVMPVTTALGAGDNSVQVGLKYMHSLRDCADCSAYTTTTLPPCVVGYLLSCLKLSRVYCKCTKIFFAKEAFTSIKSVQE